MNRTLIASSLLVTFIGVAAAAPRQEPAAPKPAGAVASDKVRGSLERALKFLDGQQKDGKFGLGDATDPGVTAIALTAAMGTCAKLGVDRPAWVGKGLDYLVGLQHPDGAIYSEGLQNYVTSASIQALVASGDAKYAPAIEKAVAFVKLGQFDEGEGFSSDKDNEYGGFGYGSPEHPDQDPKDHPDMSNTQFALQAMHDAKVAKSDPAWAKATKFLQHCQNTQESGAKPVTQSDGKVVVPGSDGGALYRPGSSKAGLDPAQDGKTFHARSYGSMTYALLKCYLFAGLDPKDPRVAGALDWIRTHYTLEVNPGFEPSAKGTEYQGLYYYYMSIGRALRALGQDTIRDGKGVDHAWRQELQDKLLSLQLADGQWTNQKNGRWMEANPVLATSYALIALCESH